MYRIIVSDPLEKTGLAMLRESGHEVIEVAAEDKDQLPELLADADALVVRSGTKVTADLLRAGKQLKVVGRAGIGVDNVDIETATSLGILVVNAPTANLISATEHTFALLLAVARNVAAADGDIKGGAWNRKKFVGAELQGKKLGIIGFGRIGQAVARRGRAFDMEILAYDPFLDADVVRRESAAPRSLEALLAEADVVTLHIPLTDDTRNLLSAERLAGIKEGAILINCARGGVVDEDALLEGLESGRIAAAGIDVFAQEPPTDYTLAQHPRVVATPHLGAQTREAQVRISTQTAKMVVSALEGSLAVSAVNLPFRPAGGGGAPFLRLGEKLGLLAGGLAEGSLQRVEVRSIGVDSSLLEPITIAALRGSMVRSLGAAAVNYVNAARLAEKRGVEVVQSTARSGGDFPTQVTLVVTTDEGTLTVAGTLVHDREPRIVRLDDYRFELVPKQDVLVVRNRDVPGVVGKLGTLLGDAGVNIAEIHLSRLAGGNALAAIRIDQDLEAALLSEVRGLDEVVTADVVDLGPL